MANEQLPNADSVADAARFYGIKTLSSKIDTHRSAETISAKFRAEDISGAVITPRALTRLFESSSFRGLRDNSGRAIPLLVLGLTPQLTSAQLQSWSGGAISACQALDTEFHPERIEFHESPDVVSMLGGLTLPAVFSPSCNLILASSSASNLLSVQSQNQSVVSLARVWRKDQELFLVPQLNPVATTGPAGVHSTRLTRVFSEYAPFLMFIRYAAGDYAWHTAETYANFTIDDAWLTEPYGLLNYHALLAQMEKHNFHTTIAFVPWNFDRSARQLAELFRTHPERYSICIHGNNHTHREFGAYSNSSLEQQTTDIQQALARMERFVSLTGVPYDRVMVFPQAVAPESTFAVLKRYNFVATANSRDVPEGSTFPADPVFSLRPFTGQFANFLSLQRYDVEESSPTREIAIMDFLGGPILLYAHVQVFSDGITAVNPYADFINKLDPHVQWASLGEVARHTYLLRQRTANAFDVQMFSNELAITNHGQHGAEYLVVRTEMPPAVVKSVLVDGKVQPFTLKGNELALQFRIPAGQTRNLQISYENEIAAAPVDISRSGLRANILRTVSDFRDLVLSRSQLGRAFVRSYYGMDLDIEELRIERLWTVGALLLLLVIVRTCWLFARKSRAHAAAGVGNANR